MGRAATARRAAEQAVALRRVSEAVANPRESRRLERVQRQLRREIGVGIPKRCAAALLRMSVPALEKWIERGRLPTVKRPGVNREEVDADALLDLAVEVTRLRERGERRALLAQAFARLDQQGRAPRKLRPNESARELRDVREQTTPIDRVRLGAELSLVGATLAARGAAARTTRVAG